MNASIVERKTNLILENRRNPLPTKEKRPRPVCEVWNELVDSSNESCILEVAMIPCAETGAALLAPTVPDGFWGDRLGQCEPAACWLWDGYLGPGQITLLTSQWKSGKTTLMSILLSQLHTGGMLADLPVAAAKAAVFSEEPDAIWAPRHRQFDLGHVYFWCQPFLGKPSFGEWLALLDRVLELHRQHGVGLLVIDTLATFLPGGNEASAGAVMAALLPLHRLTRAGMCVLLQHHPRK